MGSRTELGSIWRFSVKEVINYLFSDLKFRRSFNNARIAEFVGWISLRIRHDQMVVDAPMLIHPTGTVNSEA
jgi:hypothetical protein